MARTSSTQTSGTKTRSSAKIKWFNKLRWACYLFFPLVGLLVILLGIGLGIAAAFGVEVLEVPGVFAVIIGGALMTYVSIYFNKRS